MADWQEIKTEYITTQVSYRELAEKYGVSRVQIGNVGKKEGWVELRRRHLDGILTKSLSEDTEKRVKRAQRLQNVADKLLDTLERRLTEYEDVPMDSQTMKQLSGVLKDIKEIQMIRSEEDMEEQRARIGKLRKEAEEEKKDTVLTVQLSGVQDYMG